MARRLTEKPQHPGGPGRHKCEADRGRPPGDEVDRQGIADRLNLLGRHAPSLSSWLLISLWCVDVDNSRRQAAASLPRWATP